MIYIVFVFINFYKSKQNIYNPLTLKLSMVNELKANKFSKGLFYGILTCYVLIILIFVSSFIKFDFLTGLSLALIILTPICGVLILILSIIGLAITKEENKSSFRFLQLTLFLSIIYVVLSFIILSTIDFFPFL